MTSSFAIPFPSGRPAREKVERALRFLARAGLQPSCPLLEQEARWSSDPAYLCGSDQQRAEELLEVWSSSSPKVAWCGRGGYGATRILSRLEAAVAGLSLPPSRMLGYSDITALFAFIRAHSLPIECVHAPVVTEIPDHPQPELVLEALRGNPCPLPVSNSRLTSFRGPIWGGNLAVLASLCGTPWLPKVESGALFLEDIDEAPYRLDRFLTQLHDNGFFASARGVFLGQFSKCGQGDAGLRLVRQRLEELGVERLGELPVGHEALHLPLFLDLEYRLDPESSYLEPESGANRGEGLSVRTARHGATDRG